MHKKIINFQKLGFMKKFLLLSLALLTLVLSSCEKDEFYRWEQPDRPTVIPGGGTNGSGNNGGGNNQTQVFEIKKLYSIVMRRELPYPFQTYVLQINNGSYFYVLRYRLGTDLHVGDKISFSVYAICPNEIAVLNGYATGDGSDIGATGNNDVNAGEYWVASDPIEGTVKDVFSMSVRYSLTLFPIDSWFIETTDGKLLYVKKSKTNVALQAGDRFVYSVYTLFPNEIVALKKL